jgi:hypothetical protein
MAATPDTLHAPTLGNDGEPCPNCGAPLAADQRYCLQCGARRAEARLAFMEILGTPAETHGAAVPPPPQRLRPPAAGISPGTAAVGIGLAVLFLGVGVLVGRGGSNDTKTVAAPAPSVVTVGSGSGTATTAADTGAAFKSDWPAGKDGWTVELQALSKDSADPAKVAAAKQDAKGKGAADVGALDSDEYGSLTPNQYVVYSGVFKSKGEATKALGKLKKSFPKAKVVHVTAGGAGPVINSAKAKQDKKKLEQLQNLSGSDYSKQSRKLPKTLELPGKAPPKDNKQGGGGSGFQTIG